MVANAPTLLCQSRRKDGQPCRAPATINGRCIGHAPGLEAQRTAARRKGGQNKANRARLSKLMPPRLVSVYEELEEALHQVHCGELDPRQATAMATIASAMVRVLTAGEIEERLRRLEQASGKWS